MTDELLPTPTAGDGKSAGSTEPRRLEGARRGELDGRGAVREQQHGPTYLSLFTGIGGLDSCRRATRIPLRRASRVGRPLHPSPRAMVAGCSPLGRCHRVRRCCLRRKPGPAPNGRRTPAAGRRRTAHQSGTDLEAVLTSSAAASPASRPPPPDADAAPPMPAGYGLSSPVSLASWDPATSSWRTFQGSLLSTEDERFPRSWERWPTSGTTRHGVALPTSAPPPRHAFPT